MRFVPRLMWQVGRLLLLADIALRRLGSGEPIDTMMESLQSVADDPENHRLYGLLKLTYTEWTEAGGELHGFGEELSRRAEAEDDFRRMLEIPAQVGKTILEIWSPHALALTRLVASAGDGTPHADDR